jgi:hypothetical protein
VLRGQHHDWVERWYGPIRDPVRDAFRILRWAVMRATVFRRTPRAVSAYRHFVANMNSRANRRYRPEFYPGTLTLFNTADQSKYPRLDFRLLLRPYAKETKIIPLPGNRTGLFARPVVDELARQLQICLDRAEGKSPQRLPEPAALPGAA